MSVEYHQLVDPIKATEEANDKTVDELTINVESSYKAGAPRDKGDLVDSIGRKISGPKDDRSGIVYATSDHAIYVEFGTRKMDAQPALRAAAAEHIEGGNYIKAYRKMAEKEFAKKVRESFKF